MLNFQWPVWESERDNTKFNTPAPHSHLRHCNTNESHDTGERQFGHFHFWTFSLRGVLTFVASGLDINGCLLSYFEGTANWHCYTSCKLTTLHCDKVSFLQCCHNTKIIRKYKKKMWGVLTSVRYCTLLINCPNSHICQIFQSVICFDKMSSYCILSMHSCIFAWFFCIETMMEFCILNYQL